MQHPIKLLTIADLQEANKTEQGKALVQKALKEITILEDLERYQRFLFDREVPTLFDISLERHKSRALGIHPSAACKPGVCPLRLYYDCTNEVRPSRSFDVKSQMIFDVGTIVHRMLQTHLANMYEDQFEPEVSIKYPEHHIIGHADGLFTFSNIRIVLEIKSIKEGGNFGWEKVTASPMIDNQRQANIYCKCLDVPFTMVLYFNKNNGEMKAHILAYDPDLWANLVTEITPSVQAAYYGGPKPAGQDGYHCRRCDYEYGCETVRKARANVRPPTRLWK